MKLLTYFKSMLTGIYLSFKRFPLTIIFSAAVAAMLITISEIHPTGDTLGKIAMVLALGIPLSLSVKLLLERNNKERSYALFIGYTISLAFLFIYYNFLLKDLHMVAVSRYIAVSLAMYLSFMFIPYFPKRERFEMYIIKIATNFFITAIYAGVLFLGLSAILFSVDKLLGVIMPDKIYFYTWLCVVFIFAVSYFLAGVPLKDEALSTKAYQKPLKILLLYIVMPLITAYTAILYVYFAKIIITRQWPVGLVANLVLWYSAITAIVLFLITPIKEETKWVDTFLKFMPKIILPILAMMFVSIFIRINAYGITENRYYVLILGFWVTFVMLYYSFRKKMQNIILPVTLCVLAVISVFGPLSSFSISKLSQNKRLQGLLVKNNMLVDDVIKPSSTVSKEERIEISNILDYFNKNHSLAEVKYLPSDFKTKEMDKVFGFEFESKYGLEQNYFSFNLNSPMPLIDVQGYDYVFDSRNTNSQSGLMQANYEYNSESVKISYKGKEIYSKNLNVFADRLANKYGAENSKSLSSEEMTFADENENVEVRFIFSNISGIKDNSEALAQAKGMDFYLLINIK